MFALKLFTLFFITKIGVSSPHHWTGGGAWSYPKDSSERPSSEDSTTPGQEISELCPQQSHISNSDLEYLIKDTALKLQVKENFVKNYYPEAEKILEKYIHELKEMQEKLEDRPVHMLHILGDFADMRQRLEPEVEKIEDQLQTFDVQQEKYYDIADRSDALLKQLEKYKKICNINCEDFEIDTRFGPNIHTNIPTYSVNNFMSCITLKELNDYITEMLRRYGEEHDHVLQTELETRNMMYAQKLKELKIDLKKAAVKEFGMTMYDMLSLQDDYHHFNHNLNHNNISAELYNIEENSAEIKLRLIGLKRDVEKYRKYCMSCNSNNRRAKRDILNEAMDVDYNTVSIIVTENIAKESNIVDELLQAEIDKINHYIHSNFNKIFEELDSQFNDPDIINLYISKLEPIQHNVENEIKNEQEALETLSNRVPELSIAKILALSKESKNMILTLEAAKQYIDQYNLKLEYF